MDEYKQEPPLSMSLVLAIKNHEAVVVATDTDALADGPDRFGQLVRLPNRSVILLAGNIEAARHTVMNVVMPKVTKDTSAAGLAQLLQAALTLEIVPKLDQFKGRLELIVAGIDPIRHIEEPGLYYLDSAQGFHLQIVEGDAVAAGSTAAVTSLLGGHSFAGSNTEHLQVLAKECLSATRLRWPMAVGNFVLLGTITSQSMHFSQY